MEHQRENGMCETDQRQTGRNRLAGFEMSLRRFLIGWTALAFIVWLVAVSALESDEDCSQSPAFVCIDTRKALLGGTLFVGAPWLLGLILAVAIAGIVRWRRQTS